VPYLWRKKELMREAKKGVGPADTKDLLGLDYANCGVANLPKPKSAEKKQGTSAMKKFIRRS